MNTKNAPVKAKKAAKSANVAATKTSEEKFKPMNMVILTGNLGVDPTVLESKNGRKKAFFTLATNNTYTNKAGAQIEETAWHSLVAWGSLAEKIEAAIKKGDRVNVTGRINTRKYTDSKGVSKIFTEIVLRSLDVILPKEIAQPITSL